MKVSEEMCVRCGKKIKGKICWVNYDRENDLIVFDRDTDECFPVGGGCYKKVKENPTSENLFHFE